MKRTTKQPETVTTVLQKAICESELPLLRLSIESGVALASLIRLKRKDAK